MLIAIEGIDGSGKSTVATMVQEALNASLLHFPDDNAVTGPHIRAHLRKEWSTGDKGRDAIAFQALQIVNRLEHAKALESARATGFRHVVLSRYWPSGVVYGHLDGLPKPWLRRIQDPLPSADVYFLIDVNAETALDRMSTRQGLERYENLELLRRARGGFLDLWTTEQRSGQAHWVVLDGHRLPEVSCAAIVELVKEIQAARLTEVS